jgi:dipeptidase E
MKHILAIGGYRDQTKAHRIHKYVLDVASKERPNVCCLMQASAENNDYLLQVYDSFIGLGAEVSHLSLFGRVEPTWRDHLLAQDVIFVGGGNTRSMLALWREWGVDAVLREAYDKGVVMSGVSAGAICWFEGGVTDSVWPLGVLSAMGFLAGTMCPHYDGEAERQPAYTRMVREGEIGTGLALCDGAVAHFEEGQLVRVMGEDADSKAYYVRKEGDDAIEDKIDVQLLP